MTTSLPIKDIERDSHRLNFEWLIRLRTVAIIGQTIVICVATLFLGMIFSLGMLFIVLALETASNIVLRHWLARRTRINESLVGAVLVLDVAFLSALLYWTGGSHNPFSLLFFIHIALAALVLRSVWTWAIAVLCVTCFGVLFAFHSPHTLPWKTQSFFDSIEIQGAWVAFTVTAAVVVFFINRIQSALSRRDAAIINMREAQLRNEKLASLATLAAGAAHEFSTPLSTIAVVASELQRSLVRDDARKDIIDDVDLIREQVQRCRQILIQMSADAGESLGEIATPTTISELMDEMLMGLDERDCIQINNLLSDDKEPVLVVPLRALAQALRGIVNNAIDASRSSPSKVLIDISYVDATDTVHLIISDSGTGIPQELISRIGEPFFTTKPPGKGMGLGVFLARTVVEKFGGVFTIESEQGNGTSVMIELPASQVADAINS